MDPPASNSVASTVRQFIQDTQAIQARDSHDTARVQIIAATVNASIPTSSLDTTNDIDEGASPVMNNNDNDTNDTSTTPQLQQHQLVHQSSGLPPTPPTMANSDVVESQPERVISSAPLFADRVRNAHQSHQSGLSTPVNNLDNHSPPTPEASPRRKENLAAPRQLVAHSASSYEDSFKTANEVFSANGSTSRVHSPAEDFSTQQSQTWWERTNPVRYGAIGLGLGVSPGYGSESLRRSTEPPEPFPDFDQNLIAANGNSGWLNTINPNLIEAALRPVRSPEPSPLPASTRKSRFSSKREVWDNVDTFSGNAKSDDSPDDYDPSLAPYLAAYDEASAAAKREPVKRRPFHDAPHPTGNRKLQVSQEAHRDFEDSDRGEVRVKNYQMESDSDRDRTRPSSSDGPPSPSWRKPLHHQAALHKLRKPIQPGDDLKRPDEALLYSSSVPWKRAKMEEAKPKREEPRQSIPPRREMDSEVLRTGNVLPMRTAVLREDITSEQSQEGIIEDPETPGNEREYDMPDRWNSLPKLRDFRPSDAPADVPSPPTSAETPGLGARVLRELTPSVPPADVESPPDTAAKESLVSNNQVYKVIQENNAKRHRVASEGNSVQAKLVFPVEQERRKLRHSSKCESLRAGISIADFSRPNSQDIMHTPTLGHKRGMESTGSKEAMAAPEHLECRVHTEPIKFDYTSSAANGITEHPRKISTMPREINVGTIKAPKLRRTLRDQTLDRNSVSFDLSAQEGAVPEATRSPKLRRSSRVERLDKNIEVRRTSLYGEPDMTTEVKSPELRRFSKELHLENNQEVRRTSLGRESQLISHDMDLKLERLASDLTNSGREMPDRCSTKDRRTSSESKNPTSPRRKSFDPRLLNPIGTPLSTSLSERTALTEAEYGLARGVAITQHNNDSLLLIHERSHSHDPDLPLPSTELPSTELPSTELPSTELPSTELPSTELPSTEHPYTKFPSIDDDYDTQAGAQRPTFQAFVESPRLSSNDIIGLSNHHVDSPLTNPRAAPIPPVIQFQPPTPSDELDRSLSNTSQQQKPSLQRTPSWSQRARQFGSNLVQPLPFGRTGSLHRPRRVATEPQQRPHSEHLSPSWIPRGMTDMQSDSEDESGEDPWLPSGGDTSDVGEKRTSFLPRNMSVRMPGFRGTGGFLQGNSLGLDRHGTNNRRHYVSPRASTDSLGRAVQRRRRRSFAVPFGGGRRVEYVGLTGLWRKKEERAAQRRRQELRESIGTRLYQPERVV